MEARKGCGLDAADFYMSTCCHPDGRGVLSDWVFVTKKRVVDAMDGHNCRSNMRRGRIEHRFCRLLVGSNLRLVWPVANSVVSLFCKFYDSGSQARDTGLGIGSVLTSVRCPHGDSV